MDTTGISSLVAVKWLFPAIVGSVLAVVQKVKQNGWSATSTKDYVKASILLIGSFTIGVLIAYFLGGVFIEVWEISDNSYWFKLVYLIVGFSGAKIVDAFANNQDKWLDKITTAISNIIDKFIGKFL